MHGWVSCWKTKHIHSINKRNIKWEFLTCADDFPMIGWPTRLSRSPDLSCSAALITSSFLSHNLNIRRARLMKLSLITRLTWHFYLSCQVHSWRSKQFMNVISQTLIDWFPYGKGISTHHPSSQKLNLEECNRKTLPWQEEIDDKSFGSWPHLKIHGIWKLSSMMWYNIGTSFRQGK